MFEFLGIAAILGFAGQLIGERVRAAELNTYLGSNETGNVNKELQKEYYYTYVVNGFIWTEELQEEAERIFRKECEACFDPEFAYKLFAKCNRGMYASDDDEAKIDFKDSYIGRALMLHRVEGTTEYQRYLMAIHDFAKLGYRWVEAWNPAVPEGSPAEMYKRYDERRWHISREEPMYKGKYYD